MKDFVELNYIENYSIKINEPKDELFYYFDYDVRNYEKNMEFQHFHNFYEILISLEDNISHLIEGRFYDLNKYDFVLLKPSILHKSIYHYGDSSKRIIINFYIPQTMFGLSGDLKNLLSIFNTEFPIYRFSSEKRHKIFNLLDEIFNIHYKKASSNRLFIHAKFIEILYYIYLNKDNNLFQVEQTVNSITQKIYDISSYIHSNVGDELNLQLLADSFNISACYLSHKFKEVTGFTLINYIQMTRVREVQRLLLNSSKQVQEIGEECGFNSFSQFNRVFRKYVKISPSEFRKKRIESSNSLLRFREFE